MAVSLIWPGNDVCIALTRETCCNMTGTNNATSVKINIMSLLEKHCSDGSGQHVKKLPQKYIHDINSKPSSLQLQQDKANNPTQVYCMYVLIYVKRSDSTCLTLTKVKNIRKWSAENKANNTKVQ